MFMIKGRAWIYGDDVDTDVIIPGKYLRTKDLSLLASHVMEGLDPEFSMKNGALPGKNQDDEDSQQHGPADIRMHMDRREQTADQFGVDLDNLRIEELRHGDQQRAALGDQGGLAWEG